MIYYIQLQLLYLILIVVVGSIFFSFARDCRWVWAIICRNTTYGFMALHILRWSPGIIDPLAIRNRWPKAVVVVSAAEVVVEAAVVVEALVVMIAAVAAEVVVSAEDMIVLSLFVNIDKIDATKSSFCQFYQS